MASGDNNPQLDIDEIVRQVLAALGAEHASPAPRPAQSAPATNGRVELASKVVTVGELEQQIGNAKQLVLRRGAVVTPSARDWLRDKNIGLEYRNTSAQAAAEHRLVVGLADSRYEPAALVRAIEGDGVSVEQLARTGLVSVVGEMCDQVSSGGLLGLLLSGRASAAVCLANRRKGVRAITATDARQVGRAVDEVGANLLVVDPAGRSLFELLKMARQLACGGPRKCPDALKQHLN